MASRNEPAPRLGYQPGRSELNNVISFLEHHRRERPDRPALLWRPAGADAHATMTCAELAARVESAAAGLRGLGLGPGERAFLFVPMSPELYVAMFAVQRLGAAAVFLDSWARREQLASCARQVEPRAFIGTAPALGLAAAAPELGAAAIRVVAGPGAPAGCTRLEDLAGSGAHCPVAAVAGEDTALVTFTTGSSGEPKGADRTHRFLAAQHEALDRSVPYRPEDVDLPVFPVFSLNNIAGGVPTVIPAVDLARPAASDGAVLLAQLEAAAVSCCTLSPYLLRETAAAARASGRTLGGLRRIVTGGAPISADDVAAVRAAAPRAELHILYGSTEVEPIAHLVASEMPPPGPEAAGVCVGRPDPALECRLLRIHRGPIEPGAEGLSTWLAPSGEPGELAVRGEHVCPGYFRNPEAFRRAKVVEAPGRVWHRTGDVCRFDAEGRLWLEGRVHSAILRAGRTLLPVGPEVVMRRLEFVRAAAYLGMPDERLGEKAVAAFSVRPGAAPADPAGTVRDALLAAGATVDEVIAVPDIPLDPRHHSKVEYAELRARLLAREAPGR